MALELNIDDILDLDLHRICVIHLRQLHNILQFRQLDTITYELINPDFNNAYISSEKILRYDDDHLLVYTTYDNEDDDDHGFDVINIADKTNPFVEARIPFKTDLPLLSKGVLFSYDNTDFLERLLVSEISSNPWSITTVKSIPIYSYGASMVLNGFNRNFWSSSSASRRLT